MCKQEIEIQLITIQGKHYYWNEENTQHRTTCIYALYINLIVPIAIVIGRNMNR